MMSVKPLRTVKSKLTRAAVALLALTAFPAVLWAETTAALFSAFPPLTPEEVKRSLLSAPGEQEQVFIIGHLRADPESSLDAAVFNRLRQFLLSLPSVRTAMESAGVRTIEIQSADSANVLVDWMNQDQLDVVFAPAIVYTLQGGDYRAVYQLSQPKRDIVGRDRAFHRGVIFVNNASPLFRAPGKGLPPRDYLRQVLPDYLARRPVAFVSSYSAAGYYYPAMSLASLTTGTQPISLFCGSPEEVVKNVINGVAEIGACDKGTIEEVLAGAAPGLLESKDQLVRVILETASIPTDPVVFHERWSARSALGREIRNGILAFFNRNTALPRLESSPPDAFQGLLESRDRLLEISRRGGRE